MKQSLLYLVLPLVVILLFTVSVFAQHRTLNGNHPFEPPQTLEQWEQRRPELQRQILVSQGLYPLPEKTDLKPIVHHPIERDEYTVHGVILEVVPGYFLTGNLYVPKNRAGKMPGVLSPHGHWSGGRFFRHPNQEFEKELQSGGEKYDPSGRFPLQARCATLARLGCVVFHYDMIGYADSIQIPHSTGVREAMNTKENWGFFSPQAELRLQNTMGLQTLGSIRALDWLESLPEVDKDRIAITGASGGGTQSFILSAIDDRIAVSFPAVMVSTAMQGGCTCENAHYLRIGTGNAEIAALFAPKPQGMTAANDWTREMKTKGFPQLQRLYGLYGAEKNVALFPHVEFGHNYNFVARNDMYRFMNEHLKLGHTFEDEPVEKPFQPLTVEEMTVWSGSHAKPSGDQVGKAFERRLLREMDERSQKQLAALPPEQRNEIVKNALETMIGWKSPEPGDVVFAPSDHVQEESYGTRRTFRLIDTRTRLSTPGVLLIPQAASRTEIEISVFVSKNGVSDYLNEQGQPIAEVNTCLEKGHLVVILDLYGQGGNNVAEGPLEKAMFSGSQEPWKEFLGYTYGYNLTIFSKRVQGLLGALTLPPVSERMNITLHGLKGGAAYAAVARALLGDAVDTMIVDTEGFRFADIETLDDVNMLPGIVKYGDLLAILSLCDPKTTVIRGEK